MKTTLDLIQEVLTTKIAARETFTAFEVSREVQKLLQKNGLPIERHGNMRDSIHAEMVNLMAAQDYGRKLVSFGGPVPAYQYSPNSAQSPAQPTQTTSVTTAGGDGDGDVTDRTPDARGTLTVPAQLLRQIGCTPGNLATVTADKDANSGDSTVLVRAGGIADVKLDATESVLSEYTVDASGNVRITSLNLHNGGIGNSGGSLYNFAVENNVVVVTKQ